MAGEQVEGLPDGLREWVLSRAEETDRPPAEVLTRATAMYRLLSEHDGDPTSLGSGASVAGRGEIADTVTELNERVAAVEEDVDEKIDDVRSRVIQVKREADAKADPDHDHPELRQMDETIETTEALAADVETLRTDLDELESTFEEGFGNYEAVLEYLTDTAEELGEKTDTLASVAAAVRTRLGKLEAREARLRAAAGLKDEANRLGVGTAKCGACGSTVRLGLLSAPECPNCGGTFEGIEAARGFFGSATLTVGTRPALEGETVDELDPEDIFENE